MIYANTHDILIYVRQRMIADGISFKDLSDIMKKPYSTVTNTFKRENITLFTLNEICQALGYDLEINLIKQNQE